MYSKEDIDTWIGGHQTDLGRGLFRIPNTSKRRRTIRRSGKIKGDALEDPDRWAMTWRAFQRKRGTAILVPFACLNPGPRRRQWRQSQSDRRPSHPRPTSIWRET